MYRWWWLYWRPDQYLQGSCVLRAHIYAHVGRIWSKGEGSNARVNSVMSNAGLNDPLTPDEAAFLNESASLTLQSSFLFHICIQLYRQSFQWNSFIYYDAKIYFVSIESSIFKFNFEIERKETEDFFFLFRISKNIEMKMKKWNSYWKNIYIFFFRRISIFLRIN